MKTCKECFLEKEDSDFYDRYKVCKSCIQIKSDNPKEYEDKKTFELITREEALESLKNLDIESDNYFEEKRKLVAAINLYNKEEYD